MIPIPASEPKAPGTGLWFCGSASATLANPIPPTPAISKSVRRAFVTAVVCLFENGASIFPTLFLRYFVREQRNDNKVVSSTTIPHMRGKK
jgi:hypothetical protein